MIDKLHKLLSNDIKVYPEIRNRKFAVCVEDARNIIYKRKRTVWEYKHTTKSINIAINETIDYIYNKLTNK